jgi:hypothetical protein
MYETIEDVLRTLKARIDELDEVELVAQSSSVRGTILFVETTNEAALHSITADIATEVANPYTSPQDSENEYRIGLPPEIEGDN